MYILLCDETIKKIELIASLLITMSLLVISILPADFSNGGNSSTINSNLVHSTNLIVNNNKAALSHLVNLGYRVDQKQGIKIDKNVLLKSLETKNKNLYNYLAFYWMNPNQYSLGSTFNYKTDHITLYLSHLTSSGNSSIQTQYYISNKSGV